MSDVVSTCTCPHIDGYRIRSGLCARHNECLDRVGPVPKLDGQTFVCVKPKGHEMPHESPDGTWWEPPDNPGERLQAHLAASSSPASSGTSAEGAK